MEDFFKLYKVLPKYVEQLRDESIGGDSRLYKEDKEDRPYIGVVLKNGQKYCIPITKYKKRFHYLTNDEPDFMPIYRNGQMVAGVEFNRMIPVPDNQIREQDLNITQKDIKNGRDGNKELKKYEEKWCKARKTQITDKAQKLYERYVSKDITYENIDNCVNFQSLEKICHDYTIKHPSQHIDKNNTNHHNNNKPSNRNNVHNQRREKFEKRKRNNKRNNIKKISKDILEKVKSTVNKFNKSLIDIPKQLSEAHESCVSTHNQILNLEHIKQTIQHNFNR